MGGSSGHGVGAMAVGVQAVGAVGAAMAVLAAVAVLAALAASTEAAAWTSLSVSCCWFFSLTCVFKSVVCVVIEAGNCVDQITFTFTLDTQDLLMSMQSILF